MVYPNSTTDRTDDGSFSSQIVQTTINIEFAHPLFIRSSKSPITILFDTTFDWKSYVGWRRAVLISLSAKNKLGFVDGQ